MTNRRHITIKYKETLDFIYSQLPMYQRQGKSAFKKDLSNIIALCDHLDNPHMKIKTIHIAGTNGKGSTSHIIASILQAYGYRVGLYTSPHYMDFRERIKINGQLVSKNFVTKFVDRVKPYLGEIQASFFEITVAMAFDYFATEEVDIAVIETGLGGRLDSTNILSPVLSVITNISMDHVSMLGDSIQKIAFEKAGIIKEDTPVVIGQRMNETTPVFELKANEMVSKLSFADDLVSEKEVDESLKIMANPGPFQSENLRTSLAAIKVFLNIELEKFDQVKVKSGIKNLGKNTYYIGRWEVLGSKPRIIADSAHNEAGIKLIINKLLSEKFEKLHIVIGFVKDKEVEKILPLFPSSARFYFAKANIPRGLEAALLKAKGENFGLKGRGYVSVKNAIQAAERKANDRDLIFIGGSIFVVAEALAYFKKAKALD